MSEATGDRPSVAERTRTRIDAARRTAVDRVQEALLVVPALDLVWELGRRYRRLNGSVLAGHLTYRFFLWLAPFFLLLVATFGFGAGDVFWLGDLVTDAGVDESFGESVADQAAPGRLYALWIGLFGLVVATYGLLQAMHYVFAQAWEVEIAPRRGIVAAVAKFMVSTALVLVVLLLITAAREHGPLLRAGAAAVSLVVYTLVALAIAWVLPRRPSSLIELVPGALLTAVAVVVLHLFAQYYLPYRISDSSQVYGSLGTVFAVLFYLWCIATTIVVSALLNSVWHDRAEVLAGRPMIADPERLPPRLRRALTRLGVWGSRATDAASSVEQRVRRRNESSDGPTDEG
jgi:uncharacterized BrkB/YihY/UPF0761 family membrane protein